MALPLVMASCSETPGEPSEFEDWQNRNETYFNNLYQTAKSNPARYKVIRSWDLPENVATSPDNYIVAEVLHEGTGTESPMYTDSVTIHYRGYFIPTTSFPAGYVFDQTWTGDYDLTTMNSTTYTASTFIDGFTTALLNMHPGDRWRVTIPYALGYGESTYAPSGATTSIPGYSTLVFDLTLVSFHRPGTTRPYAELTTVQKATTQHTTIIRNTDRLVLRIFFSPIVAVALPIHSLAGGSKRQGTTLCG